MTGGATYAAADPFQEMVRRPCKLLYDKRFRFAGFNYYNTFFNKFT